jgi:hypothetical protein
MKLKNNRALLLALIKYEGNPLGEILRSLEETRLTEQLYQDKFENVLCGVKFCKWVMLISFTIIAWALATIALIQEPIVVPHEAVEAVYAACWSFLIAGFGWTISARWVNGKLRRIDGYIEHFCGGYLDFKALGEEVENRVMRMLVEFILQNPHPDQLQDRTKKRMFNAAVAAGFCNGDYNKAYEEVYGEVRAKLGQKQVLAADRLAEEPETVILPAQVPV